MATVSTARRIPDRIIVHDVTWREYSYFLRAFGNRSGWRLTYDRGTLEIMSPSSEHEQDIDLLGRFVVVMTEELKLPLRAGRCTTYRRRRAKKGLEPDHSWWIANEPLVRRKRRIDLKVDPPPDLAIEVDVSRHSVDRMAIYARLRVPEVWELRHQKLVFHVLQPTGRYAEQTHSLAFPPFSAADLLSFLALTSQHDDNEIVQQFRAFVRQRLTQP